MSKSILVLILSLATCGLSSASSLYVSGSGQFASTDTPGTLVSPNAPFSFVFTLDSNPVPVAGSVTSLGFDAPVYAFQYTLNGVAVSAVPSGVRFNTLANGGLFDLTIGTGLSASQFSFQGLQAFSGSTAAPVLTLGNYVVTSFTYSDATNFDAQATRLSASITPTPEPSSVLLLFCGLVTFLAVPVLRSVRAR